MTHRVAAVLTSRWQQIKDRTERDRGDSPVTTALIIAGLVLLAAVVVTWAVGLADEFMDAGDAADITESDR
jgi:hypothetical protein